MKVRSTLSFALLALAATSTMAAPAFAKAHHHAKKVAMVAKKPMAAKATPAPAAATPKK